MKSPGNTVCIQLLSFNTVFVRFVHLQCGRPGFSPCIGKIPWRRKWQPTPVFLPGKIPWMEEPGRLQSMGSQSQTQLSNSTFFSLWGLSTLLCAVVNCFFLFHYGNGPQSIVSSVVRKLLRMAVLWTFRVCLLVNVCTYFFQAFVSQWISGVLGIHIFIFRICEWTSESLLTICRILDVGMHILEVLSLVWNFR